MDLYTLVATFAVRFVWSVIKTIPAGMKRWHNVTSASMQRHDVASTLMQRCIKSCASWDPIHISGLLLTHWCVLIENRLYRLFDLFMAYDTYDMYAFVNNILNLSPIIKDQSRYLCIQYRNRGITWIYPVCQSVFDFRLKPLCALVGISKLNIERIHFINCSWTGLKQISLKSGWLFSEMFLN